MNEIMVTLLEKKMRMTCETSLGAFRAVAISSGHAHSGIVHAIGYAQGVIDNLKKNTL
jgi:hypothetical protein